MLRNLFPSKKVLSGGVGSQGWVLQNHTQSSKTDTSLTHSNPIWYISSICVSSSFFKYERFYREKAREAKVKVGFQVSLIKRTLWAEPTATQVSKHYYVMSIQNGMYLE